MRRTLFTILFAAAACGATHRLGDGDGGTLDPLRQLEQETGHAWSVRWHSELGTPAFLEGATAPMARTASDGERAGRDFLRQHRALFAMNDGDDVNARDSTTDELGMTHVRFTEEIAGRTVRGAELVLHFAADGSLVRINGRYIPITDPLGDPLLGKDEARVAAVAGVADANPALRPDSFTTSAPRLFVVPVAPKHGRLAWRVAVAAKSDTDLAMLEVFVDANDGSVLAMSDERRALDGRGVGVFGDAQTLSVAESGTSYVLEDLSRGRPATRTYSASGKLKLPGAAVRSKDPTRWDEGGSARGAAVDAHAFVAATWDYFERAHGRSGVADDGKGVHATVHFGGVYAGAFWTGKQLVFGDGDGATWSPLAGALDVVAHEFSHGVIEHTAALFGDGQSGALAEALADFFACVVAGDWQIGETVYHPGGKPQPLRDLADPHAGGAPSTLAEYDDAAGVHRNSTIASHAAYAMAGGLGSDAAARLWYRALAFYLYPTSDFADAADATLASARDLGLDESKVRGAWQNAGVLK